MKHSSIKKQSQQREADQIFIPHSSWARPTQTTSTGERLPPEEFWARLGL